MHDEKLEPPPEIMVKGLSPLPDRLAKGDVIETWLDDEHKVPQKVFRSSGALYTLRRSGAIEDCHVAAAEMWARDYETGVLGARDPQAGKSGAKPDIEYALLSRAAAISRCQAVERNLGKVSMRFMTAMMVGGLSVNQMEQQMRKDRKKIAGAIELLLEQLVELYDDLPGIAMR
ncbi:hypothetical protein [Acetobacter orientalis]|uniref:hypothetical protein n=1 Tax=Acetobacter orientalis TaxID=146474 RepID=UPI0039EB98D7